jgi:hypothetical protein
MSICARSCEHSWKRWESEARPLTTFAGARSATLPGFFLSGATARTAVVFSPPSLRGRGDGLAGQILAARSIIGAAKRKLERLTDQAELEQKSSKANASRSF